MGKKIKDVLEEDLPIGGQILNEDLQPINESMDDVVIDSDMESKSTKKFESITKCQSKIIKNESQKKSFAEFMKEDKALNRWIVLRIALIGVLAGTILGFVISMMGIVKI